MVSSIEHPSIIEPVSNAFLNRVVQIPVNRNGLVEIENVAELIQTKRPGFVSVLAAHNETIFQTPCKVEQFPSMAVKLRFHCDATQWCGKLSPLGFDQCSSFSFSAHKFGGPKGVGGFFAQEPIRWIRGGGQEMESRGGTENFPSIEGMRIAWKQTEEKSPFRKKGEKERKNFEKKVKELLQKYASLEKMLRGCGIPPFCCFHNLIT